MSTEILKIINICPETESEPNDSDIYNLSTYNDVLLTYWRWYTNNLGNNPGNDIWNVQVSSDSGIIFKAKEIFKMIHYFSKYFYYNEN